MSRKIKTLGFGLVISIAALSMTATANATQIHVNTPNQAVLLGQPIEKHKFQVTSAAGGPNVQCNQAEFEATTSQLGSQQITFEEVTVTPQYTGCTFLGLNAVVTMNGCKYTFTQVVPTASKTALIDVAGCTAANPKIEIHVPGCTLTIPQQTGLSHVTMSQNGLDVELNITLAGVTWESHGAACGHQPETVVKHDVTYVGKVTVKGFQHQGTTQVTHSGHQYLKGTIGAQVGLVVT